MIRHCAVTLILVSLICGCSGNGGDIASGSFPPELISFSPYEGNPVFAGTASDTWDRMIRERGWILKENDGWHMWYTGYNDDRSDMKYLGYATSPDGYTWTRHPDNPLYTERWVEDMHVMKHEGIYYMVAEGRDDIAHLLVSTDRVHWEDRGDLEIRRTNGRPISPGPYGTPTLWRENDTWYLFYERNDQGVWLATSPDMVVWTNVRDDPVIAMGPESYDRHAVAVNQVLKYKERYYAYYHATAFDPWRDWTTCVAASDDLVHWTKYPGNPIVTGNKSSGIIVPDAGRFILYTMHPDVRVWLPDVVKKK